MAKGRVLISIDGDESREELFEKLKAMFRIVVEEAPDIVTLHEILAAIQTTSASAAEETKVDKSVKSVLFVSRLVATLEAVQDMSALPAALEEALREEVAGGPWHD
jgi:hypothetical protein